MKKIFFVGLLLVVTAFGFGQKIKTKDDIAYVDDAPFLNWKTAVAGSQVSIWGLQAAGEEIFALYQTYTDPKKVTNGNPKGEVRYIELNFLTLKKKCEIASVMHNGLVKFLIENKIYVDGVLNEANVDLVVQKFGMRFSEARPGGNVNIYINE